MTNEDNYENLEEENEETENESLDDSKKKTKVTSVAEEEKRTGQKIELPDEEQLVNNAQANFLRNKRNLWQILSQIKSNKRLIRTFMAILDLPTENVNKQVKGEHENAAYAYGQQMINDRFIISYYHIKQEAKKQQEENNNSNQEQEKENENAEQQ